MDTIIFQFSPWALFSMERNRNHTIWARRRRSSLEQDGRRLDESNSHFLAHRRFSVVNNSLLEDPRFVDSHCDISSRHQHERSFLRAFGSRELSIAITSPSHVDIDRLEFSNSKDISSTSCPCDWYPQTYFLVI